MKNLRKKGISLIVLVITIIVMIILATAIILSLNSSNIVEKAKEAKTASDMANAKNVVAVALGEWELMTSSERANYTDFAAYAESKLQGAGYKVDENNGLNVSSNGVISTVYVGSDNRKAIIPEGFTVSTKASEDTVTEGLVISDAKGNEFVWVPVDDFENNFKRTTTYNGTITDPGSRYNEPANQIDVYNSTTDFSETLTVSLTNDLTGEWAEYAAMRASVNENGGFYIARYEAGKEGTNTVVSKKGVTVWGQTSWGLSMTLVNGDLIKNEGKGAVGLSRNMYKGSSSVVSTLCYGVQWDSALQFIAANPDHADYPLDSTGKGYYSYDEDENEINPFELQVTGSNDDYATNNIYDMAGNVMEWTMELGFSGMYTRVMRGGLMGFDGSNYPASHRCTDPAGPDYAEFDYGFRVALYLK